MMDITEKERIHTRTPDRDNKNDRKYKCQVGSTGGRGGEEVKSVSIPKGSPPINKYI